MMKKLICISMTTILAFVLTACEQTPKTEPTNSSITDTQFDSTPDNEEANT